jgi:hypothetical protein
VPFVSLWFIIAIGERRGIMVRKQKIIEFRWLALFLLVAALGCSASSQPKASANKRDLHENLLVKYAEHHIKQKNFREAMRFVEAISADSPNAARVPELKKQIEQLIIDHDAEIAERYSNEKTIPIDLNVDLSANSGREFLISGKATLPRYTRLKISVWREDAPNNWMLFSEEYSEVGPGSRFQANLPSYQNGFDKAEIEKELNGNFELKISSCFRNSNDQPESVIKLVGEKGGKLTGDWIERSEADGNCLRYNQRYKLQTQVNPPDCVHIKVEKQ